MPAGIGDIAPEGQLLDAAGFGHGRSGRGIVAEAQGG
jgi:hypothetical protein